MGRTTDDVGRGTRITAAFSAMLLAAGLLTVGELSPLGAAEPVAAAPSTSQAWVTAVSSVTGAGVGAQRTLTFDTGLTAIEQTTSFTGNCLMQNPGAFVGPNATAFMEPDPPSNVLMAGASCAGPVAGGGSRVASITFSKPVIAPVIHPWNLDASRAGATGTSMSGNPISLTVLDKNNALEVTGTTFNSTLQAAINTGCAANDGSNPNGGCGSLRLTADGPVQTFTLANNTADSPLPAVGGDDGWGYTLSYPTAPLTKAFSPTSIQTGGTSALAFTISNPASATQPTLTPLDFTDTLPSGLTIASGGVTDNGLCGSPTVTDNTGAALAAGAAGVRAGNITVAAGTSCVITVQVTASTPGSYTNDTDNLSTSVANLIPDADTTLTVTEAIPTPLETCTPEETLATQRWWFFGNRGVLDFGVDGSAPTASVGTALTGEGSTVVTDTSGQLLFWTNGQTVYDRNGNAMAGSPLQGTGASAVQTVAAFPAAGNPGTYFIVSHTGSLETGTNSTLMYSIVDMSLNGGLGGVTTKDVQFGPANTASEALTAVPNATGDGFWVVTYTNSSPNVLAYEFDADGLVSGTPVVSAMPTAHGNAHGSIYFDADLTRAVLLSSGSGGSVVRILQFNAATGAFQQELSWPLAAASGSGNVSWYTADFSPAGDYVYVSEFAVSELYRFRIAGATTGSQVLATQQNLGPISSVQGGHVRRAPDGKMYVAANGTAALSVVNDPDNPTDPDFDAEGFPLPAGATSRYGLPQMVTGCPVPLEFDFGDAPDSYGTGLASDGPRHRIMDGIRLGATIDSETDGQPTAAADGDGADEDGVAFNPSLGYATPTIRTGLDPVSQQPVENTLRVQASTAGFVSVWVDGNQDGDFLDAGEQVANATPVTAGANELTFSQASNPAGITSYVRVRYSTDAASIAAPTGAAPDGEVEDYRVLVERLVQPDTCVAGSVEYSAFTFSQPAPADTTGTGAVGSTAIYRNVSVVDGVAIDMVAEVVAGQMSTASRLPNGFGTTGATALAGDDAGWNIASDATIRYSFYEAGTTNPVEVNAVFTVNDMDGAGANLEVATFDVGQLASYGVSALSTVTTSQSGSSISFHGHGDNSGDVTSRFQFAIEQRESFEVRWQGSGNSGFGFDGDGDLGIQPPACEDFGDAPASYGTLVAADGPRHRITPGVFLGAAIDVDADGQPTAAADGDGADDDGVAFNPSLGYATPTIRTGLDPVSQQPVENTLEVEASANGFVSVWVDGNQDGDFLDAGEQVANATPVSAGSNEITFTQGTNPAGITSYVRVRYSTDAASIAAPTGAAPDGEVEDYRVLVERLVQPDACTVSGVEHYAFTFSTPTQLTGTGGVGSTARYSNVTVVNGVAVDMVIELLAGSLDAGQLPPNGLGVGDTVTGIGLDDARWQINTDARVRYTFYEAGTTTPIEINAVFTANDMDGSGTPSDETATFRADDLASYAVTQGSAVRITESGGNVTFRGTIIGSGVPAQRFQVVVEGRSTFDVDWHGFNGSGFGFDGDGDLSIQPSACSDFGDAPASYGTALADDGPRHTIVPGLLLGSLIDFDADGVPSADADSDDTDRLADEDGVANPIVVTVGDVTTVTVSATNTTSDDATLAGWIDLDGDGTFDAGELVTVVVPAGSGTDDYELVFPAGTGTVDSYARFRLFPEGVTTISPTGAADAGEVEDYPVTVLERSLSVDKLSTMTANSRPGDTVTYTVTLTNTGEGDYTTQTPASLYDDLAGVLDDATYRGDVTATASDGSTIPAAVFVAPSFIVWSGPLAAGESVVVRYSVTLAGGGDGTVRNVAWVPEEPPTPGVPPTEIPSCDPPTSEGTDPVTGEPCATTESLLPKLTIEKTADTTDLPADGSTVTYTIRVTNAGPGAFTTTAPAHVTDDLAAVLDDGAFGTIVAPASGAAFDEDAAELSWSGALAAGAEIEIVYTVIYDADAAGGDHVLLNTACVPEDEAVDPDANCDFVQIPGAALVMDKSVSPADGTVVDAGQQVTYTLTFENVGEAPAAVAALDDLSGVLDDAALTVGPTADAGLTATLTGDELAITGEVPVGRTLTVVYTVTVEAFPDQADHVLGNVLSNADGSCPPGGCPETENPIRHFSVVKSATPTTGVLPGDTVTYTLQITNDGEGDYLPSSPAGVTDDMSDVLDDAAYNGDAVATASDGSQVPVPAFTDPVLSWAGPLAAGESVTIVYSVTVTNLGDHELVNTAAPVCAGGVICDPPTPAVELPLPHIVPSKSSVPATGEALEAGDVVTYTLTWTNDGEAAGPVDATDDLSDVLDDADVTREPTVDAAHAATIAVTRAGATLRVVGQLAAGDSVTVVYEVTIRDDGDRGDNSAGNVLTPDVPPYACEDLPGCDPFVPPATVHPIRELDDWKTVTPASGATVQPGQQVTFTLHFASVGQADVDVDREDAIMGVLDDATLTSPPTASDAVLSVSALADGRFRVTGTLTPGQVVTVEYTVTVNPDGARGDDRLGNFLVDPGEDPPTECAPADPDRPDCTMNHVSNVVAAKAADPASGTRLAQGARVTYTLTFENVGTDALAAPVAIDYTDDLSGVLDDATLSEGPRSSDAAVAAAVEADTIRVTGTVATGETVTVVYTVTVRAYGEQSDHVLGNVVAITGEEFVCAPGSLLCTEHPLSPPDPLAQTGPSIELVAGGALALLLGGGALLVIVMRRRRRDA